MDVFLDVLKIILPSCITGLATFLVTKYNYHKNVPLDKMELTYNRLYYPIYRLIQDVENVSKIIEKSEIYLNKYVKYADRSTIVAFKFLKENPNDKKALSNYRGNIINISINLRRRLGYLEPNLLNMYTYSSPKEKRMVRFLFEMLGMYLPIFLRSVKLENEYINILLIGLFFISLICWMIEMTIVMCDSIRKWIGRMLQRINDRFRHN